MRIRNWIGFLFDWKVQIAKDAEKIERARDEARLAILLEETTTKNEVKERAA